MRERRSRSCRVISSEFSAVLTGYLYTQSEERMCKKESQRERERDKMFIDLNCIY